MVLVKLGRIEKVQVWKISVWIVSLKGQGALNSINKYMFIKYPLCARHYSI